MPVARLTHTWTESDKRVSRDAQMRIEELMKSAGARDTWNFPAGRCGAYHLMGSCRMGNALESSVVDQWGRTHDVPNLYIADGSVFVTSSPSEPTLTIQALALRTADQLVLQARGSV
jgi:choline dehydrogenase-like flavoprotein